MKVDGRIATNRTSQVSSSKTKKNKKTKTVPNESALVCLSEIADAIKAELDSPEVPFDEVKVQEIKNAIAQGRFTINTEAIANGILNMAADLIAKR